jgi:flagellar biosynthesis/type III secretory pathway protein FliH
MSRVLHEPALRSAPRAVADIEPSLDPVVRAVIDRAAAAAYERGHREGREVGRREGRDAVARLGEVVAKSAADLVAAVRSMRVEQATGTVDLATAIAAHVLDREPGDGGEALLGRVRSWLAEIDGGPVELAVSDVDAEVMATAVSAIAGGIDRSGAADGGGVTVVVDPTLVAGEARLTGAWSLAELSRAARWDEVRQVLDA